MIPKISIGKFVNEIVDRMLPGKLGDIAGDIAGAVADLKTGNIPGALNNLKDTFSKVIGLSPQMSLIDFLGGRRMPIPFPGSFTPTLPYRFPPIMPGIYPIMPEPHGRLQVDGNKIHTPGGYTVENLGNTNWKITSPNGKSTLIWGDPHVSESDGGRWDWDAKTMTFSLPDGTKITANATGPLGVTTDFHVYYGNQRVSATGVNTGNPQVSNVRYDAYRHDARMDDGSRVFLGGDGDDWFKESGGGREIIGGGGYEALKLGREYWSKLFSGPRIQPHLPPGGIVDSILDEERRRKIQQAAASVAGGGNVEDLVMLLMGTLLDKAEKDLRGAVRGLGSNPSQKQLMELQLKMQKFQRLYDTMTNMMKTFHDTKMTAIRNIKA